MGRDYKVIDADGHILEPVDMWDNYMEPKYRARAPRMFVRHGRSRALERGRQNPRRSQRLRPPWWLLGSAMDWRRMT